jgi:intracellular septation protein
MTMNVSTPPAISQTRKQLLDFGPLVIFFIANWKAGIFYATGIFMAATILVLIYTYFVTGKIAKVPLASAILVGVFGGLTIYLQDETFIKVKVTLINGMFSVILLGGLVFGKAFIKDVMGEAIALSDAAWRSLTLRWGVFFGAMAILNEVVWRHATTDQWVTFKVFGLMGLTLLFAFANAPYMMKHMEAAEAAPDKNPSAD